MSNSIKTPVVFLTLTLLILLPKATFAWEDQHGRDQGGVRHWHSFHAHSNPDLTLVSGMDTMDGRVLIASDPDQTTEVVDQPAAENVVTVPAQTVGADMDSYIVNVPNNKGGYTPVLIKKWGNAYLGPQGELYYPFPQVSELKVMYGI